MHAVSPLIERTGSASPWYKHRWPWLLMLGPFIIVIAGTITIWIAYSQQDAMVVDDYYKQGKAINQDLRRDRIAAGLGLSFDGRYDPAAGKMSGTLLGFGKPVAGKISIRLAHATLPQKDFRLDATLDQRGAYSVELPMLERARWQVVVESERRDWRLSGAWKWPQQQTIDIKADLPSAD